VADICENRCGRCVMTQPARDQLVWGCGPSCVRLWLQVTERLHATGHFVMSTEEKLAVSHQEEKLGTLISVY
jgi:hypothetical protein